MAAIVPAAAVAPQWAPSEGRELIGKPAPEFAGLDWLGAPLTMRQLRGKVVLIRFWLARCSYCENSAAALNDLYKRYGNSGLVVIGIHHPKSEDVKDRAVVRDAAARLGFRFPIAIDNDWSTINRFWLGGKKRSFTSASILIDKRGFVRWVHEGGVLALPPAAKRDGSAFASLDSTIQTLLKEPV